MYRKKRFWARLAGMPIWLETKYAYTHLLFRDYIIAPSEADKDTYKRWREQGGLPGAEPFSVNTKEIEESERWAEAYFRGLPEDYLESLIIYLKICESLLTEDILLFHSSAVKYEGEVYLFAAPSGTGKSTHARLWREYFKEKVEMINDDKPLLGFESDGTVLAYGSPHGGIHHLQTNTSGEVKGIVVLSQGKENKIRRLSFSEAYPLLFKQTYRSTKNEAALIKVMDLVGKLALLPVYLMECTISREAVRMAYSKLKGEIKS